MLNNPTHFSDFSIWPNGILVPQVAKLSQYPLLYNKDLDERLNKQVTNPDTRHPFLCMMHFLEKSTFIVEFWDRPLFGGEFFDSRQIRESIRNFLQHGWIIKRVEHNVSSIIANGLPDIVIRNEGDETVSWYTRELYKTLLEKTK
jgi:hypothetical protein